MLFKSGFPFNTYLLIIITPILISTFLILELNLYVLAVYLPIALLLSFAFFSRYSSRIEITDELEMKIVFFFPWDKNLTIDLRQFKYVDYARGFYDPFDDRRLGYLSLLRTCYDLIMLSDNKTNSQVEVKVNMKIGTFRQILKCMTVDARLSLIRLNSKNEITW